MCGNRNKQYNSPPPPPPYNQIKKKIGHVMYRGFNG